MYRDAVDHWTLLDNSGDTLKTVAVSVRGVVDTEFYKLLQEKSQYEC
jgi:hypothetical protein